ncbi:M4 family metallopeptidase [Streptomyces sp. NPDC097619]|uniref:M4 family metallopeptidase n=1 Tax=Streptomyces sp. NPDC097619 TaxID=3157228 RepID=UPI0033263D39
MLPATAHAEPAPPAAEVVPGEGTATPSLVAGLAEPARAAGSPAEAAVGHLADRKGRYAIADPRRDLTAADTLTEGAEETVRFRQKHRGVPVFGAQYVVRMEHRDGRRVVTGTSGRYFTGLTVDTRAAVTGTRARERALAAVREELSRQKLAPARTAAKPGAPAARTKGTARPLTARLSAAGHGLVVLPRGAGVLAHHVTVTGADPATGGPVKREVYVDARTGFPVLSYSSIQEFGPVRTTAAGPTSATPGTVGAVTVGAVTAAGGKAPVTAGSGVRLNGAKVPLSLYRDKTGYTLSDYGRTWSTSKNPLTTYDATGKRVDEVAGTWPSGIAPVASATKKFGKAATESGAVDAHWAAGQVYDYFAAKHGRDSLDGRGGAINSLVGVRDQYGLPYVNAFWDGTKMVYGTGDEEYKPLSADLDVVGHEMTHGIVEHTAGLVYTGQSGALNEAVADYFGNAIDVTASGTPMGDPDAGLLGEDLCRTQSPRECALRDLNDGRTTAKDFLGATFGTDNGGVHLNSTIFSGALWDIREDLGAKLADRIVYRALTRYLTPLDGFTQGRAAVLAAARDLKADAGQRKAVKRAFDAHGIVPGWEKALGVDSDKLLGDVNTTRTQPGAGGGWWASSSSDESGEEAYSVYAGRTDGKGGAKRISPNDGRAHVYPDTDGKTVVWAAYGSDSVSVLSRPLAGGPVRTVWTQPATIGNVRVSGGVIAFQEVSPRGQQRVGYLRPGDREPVYVDGGSYEVFTAMPTLNGSKLGYAKLYTDADGFQQISVEVADVRTGRKVLVPPKGGYNGLASPVVTGQHVYWLVDDIPDDNRMLLRRADLDGTRVTDLIGEQDPSAHFWNLDATDSVVSLQYWKPDFGPQTGPAWSNDKLPKVVQTDADGRNLQRISCNRGEQLGLAADTGRRTVWLDGTTGHTDLVTRARPAGRC